MVKGNIFMRAFLIFLAIFCFSPFFIPESRASVLRLGLGLEPPHLDPTAGAAAAIDEVVYANLFEGLTRIDENGAVRPGLAEKWRKSSNGLEWVFELKRHVRFHDGSDFNAEDVVFSLNRARDSKGLNAQSALYNSIKKIEVLDEFRIKITLKWPDASLAYHLGWGDAVIVSSAGDDNRVRPNGTGPFRFGHWRSGSHVRLERFTPYHGQKGGVEAVEFHFISDPAAARLALLAGDIDGFPNFPAPESVKQFEKDARFRVEIGETEGETIIALNNKAPPFDQRDVRRAMSMAIHRGQIIKGAMFGYGAPIGSHFPPFRKEYEDLTSRYKHNSEKAKSIFKARKVESLTLIVPPPAYARRSSEIIASQLKKAGVTVRIIPVEWAEWLERVFRNKDYQMTIISHTEPDDINIYARESYYFNYHNPTFNELIARLGKTTSIEARNRLYREAQRIIAEDAVNVFLFQLPKIGISASSVQGLWAHSPIQANDVTSATLLRQ